MAFIAIEMLREHRFVEDAKGNTRVLPRKWVGELDEEAAIVAIASGAARARVTLNAEQSLAIEVVQAAIAGDNERVAALMAPPPADTDGDASSAPPSAAVVPVAPEVTPADVDGTVEAPPPAANKKKGR